VRVVVDSNILVSGLLSPHGPPAQILRLALRGDLTLLHDARIVAEYREVLLRPRFGFDPNDAQALLHGLERAGAVVLAKPLPVELPDPDDLPFLEVAVSGSAAALVTGNRRHYRPLRGKHQVEILSPQELLERLSQSPEGGPEV
jgi:putative PIN family toxin of toxin-antitoxin system